jgi:hypothetical protein
MKLWFWKIAYYTMIPARDLYVWVRDKYSGEVLKSMPKPPMPNFDSRLAEAELDE